MQTRSYTQGKINRGQRKKQGRKTKNKKGVVEVFIPISRQREIKKLQNDKTDKRATTKRTKQRG